MATSGQKIPVGTSRLPMVKRRRIETNTQKVEPIAQDSESTTRSGMKRSVSNSSIKSTSSSAGKVKPPVAPATSAGTSSKQLFTVGKVTKPTRPLGRSTVQNTMRARSATPPPTTAKVIKPATSATKSAATVSSKRPKRAAWDTKGQLEDLNIVVQELNQRLGDIENQNQQLTVEKVEKIQEAESKFKDQMLDMTEQHTKEVQRLTSENEDLMKQKEKLKRDVDTINDQVEQLHAELRLARKENAGLKLTEKENAFTINSLTDENSRLTNRVQCLEASLKKAEDSIVDLEQEKRLHETERRKLHNTIQELKGNIRVFCRVRPTLNGEKIQQEIFEYPDQDRKKVILTKPVNLNESSINDTMKRMERLDFSFDKVFQPISTQSDVFLEISQLVQSALDGYNVCIFAYGQTGSGKTYTMQGPDHMSKDTEGMIPRSIEQVFDSARQLSALGWEYKMEASFLEIYNETIRDLLGNPGKDEKYEIKSASGEIVVTNLTVVTVTQPRQVENLFERATKNRHVAETQCNARSSRSHSVFTLKISGKNSVTSESCVGTLNLVDLAGSERLKESKSEGDRLKETQCINTSLSALGNVIMSLAAKKSHIPYRDSKLTYLLQNSLGGNSKTLMFVNVSPHEEHFNETVNSLRFAIKVNNCSIGTARKVLKS